MPAPAVRRFGRLLLLLLPVVGAALVATSGLPRGLSPWLDPRPAVAIDHADGPAASRSIFLTAGETHTTYDVVGAEVGSPVRSLPSDGTGDPALSETLRTLLDGRDPLVATGLADWGIDLVALHRGAPTDLVRRLDATAGMTRMGDAGDWSSWRVLPEAAAADVALAPPRLRTLAAGETHVVPVTGAHGATSTELNSGDGTTLVVAEPRAWTDSASVTFAGRELTARPGEGRPTYDLPAGPGRLEVALVDPMRPWRLGQIALWAVVAFLALPFGRRPTQARP